MISREKLIQEQQLRNCIRKLIKKELGEVKKEENKLRLYIRQMIKESKVESGVPHHSTGINVLENLLKKIVPILEEGYKSLTTNEEQRESFRAHIINAINKSLAAEKHRDRAGENDSNKFIAVEEDNLGLEEQEDETDIKVSVGEKEEGEEEEEQFIDIDNDSGPSKEEEEEEKVEDFTIRGHNETGRNVALETYEKIESQILDAYSVLEDEEDEEDFYSYLLTNVRLYLEKFETELQSALQEPYEKEEEEI